MRVRFAKFGWRAGGWLLLYTKMPTYPKLNIEEASPRTEIDVKFPKATPRPSQKTAMRPKNEQARKKDAELLKRVKIILETNVKTLKPNNRSALEVPKTRTRMPQDKESAQITTIR